MREIPKKWSKIDWNIDYLYWKQFYFMVSYRDAQKHQHTYIVVWKWQRSDSKTFECCMFVIKIRCWKLLSSGCIWFCFLRAFILLRNYTYYSQFQVLFQIPQFSVHSIFLHFYLFHFLLFSSIFVTSLVHFFFNFLKKKLF